MMWKNGCASHAKSKWSFDLYNILCIFTPGDRKEDADALIKGLTEIAQQAASSAENRRKPEVLLPNIPALAMTPRDAFYANTEIIPFKKAAGRMIAEFVMVYPPGIPIFIPGEIITEDNINYIEKNLEAGLPVQGPEDDTLHMIRVIKEQQAIL